MTAPSIGELGYLNSNFKSLILIRLVTARCREVGYLHSKFNGLILIRPVTAPCTGELRYLHSIFNGRIFKNLTTSIKQVFLGPAFGGP